MNRRTPVLSFLVKPKTKAQPIPKPHKYFFLMLHFLFGMDLGFIQCKSSKRKFLVKLITLIQSSALFAYITFVTFNSNYGGRYPVWYLMDTLLFYIFSLRLLVTKTTYFDYQTDLSVFDAEIKEDSLTYGVENKLIVWFILTALYRLALSFAHCHIYLDDCIYPSVSLVAFNMSGFGLDVVLIIHACVLYAAYLRLKRFTVFVKNYGRDVISCQYLYKSLVEMIERMEKTFNLVFIMILVSNTIDVTVTMYYPFAAGAETRGALKMSVAYIIVAQELMVLFAPAFTAGLMARQVGELRVVLYDKMIKDIENRNDIRRFAAYIDGRSLRLRVWRVVPLDWRLPVVVLNVIVTYLIVMIQFTHKN